MDRWLEGIRKGLKKIRTEKNKDTPSAWRLLAGWAPPAAYGVLIFYFSSGPAPIDLPEIVSFDKLSHFAEYAVMCALLIRALQITRPGSSFRVNAATAAVIAAAYGASDEIHQIYVPDRCAELLDALSDAAGALTAACVYILWKSQRP